MNTPNLTTNTWHEITGDADSIRDIHQTYIFYTPFKFVDGDDEELPELSAPSFYDGDERADSWCTFGDNEKVIVEKATHFMILERPV
jgi:hypothetical protein